MKTKRQRQEEAFSRRENDYERLVAAYTKLEQAAAIVRDGNVPDDISYADMIFTFPKGCTSEYVEQVRSILIAKTNAAMRDITNLKAKLS